MSEPTNRDSDKFMLRLPDGMRDRIKVAASRNGRSMNAEIVATLETAYPTISTPSIGWRGYRLMATMTEQQRDDFLAEMEDYWRDMAPDHELKPLMAEIEECRLRFSEFEARQKRQMTESEISALIDELFPDSRR